MKRIYLATAGMSPSWQPMKTLYINILREPRHFGHTSAKLNPRRIGNEPAKQTWKRSVQIIDQYTKTVLNTAYDKTTHRTGNAMS